MSNENIIDDMVNRIVSQAKAANPPNKEDYIGKDGYLYCGKCNTRKQCDFKFKGRVQKVPTMCKCEKEKKMHEEELERQNNHNERVSALKNRSCFDEKFKLCSFDTLIVTEENKKQISTCKRYAEKFVELYENNQGLLLYGNVGTGKTHLACCIGNYLMEDLKSVFILSLTDVLQKARFKTFKDEEAFFSRMNSVKLLIIDDLGAERSTDYAKEIVYSVVDCRYRSKKPMIVTTNLSLSEMQGTQDMRCKRIYDRIFEVCYPIEFVGKSWRIKEAANRFDNMKHLLEE